jgi:hypothetical protein
MKFSHCILTAAASGAAFAAPQGTENLSIVSRVSTETASVSSEASFATGSAQPGSSLTSPGFYTARMFIALFDTIPTRNIR